IYHAANSWGTSADFTFDYSRPAAEVYVGDWDGDGTDSVATRTGSTIEFSNSLENPDEFDGSFSFGRDDDELLVGDWDGDGVDTFAARRGNELHVRNALGDGPADQVVSYGRADDTVLVGDWNGDGADTLGVRRGNEYLLSNTLSDGPADTVARYGRADDAVVVGDWDGDGADTLGVRRGPTVLLHDQIADGPAETVVDYGRADDGLLVGDWDGDGVDTPAVRRAQRTQEGVLAATRAASEGDADELRALTDLDGFDDLWFAFQEFYEPPQTPTSVEYCEVADVGLITCEVQSDDYDYPIGHAFARTDPSGEWEVIGYEIVTEG
ncbi:MAG: hypothetical protein ACTHXO_01815, partial [Actinomycetaceae bacterium]